MKLASVRIITSDLERLIAFYEQLTGITAQRPAPVFAEFVSPGATLAIGDIETVAIFGEDSARPADNRSVIIEWEVADVDAEYARLSPDLREWVQTPTTMPWGNRSALLRDPDGNLVNLYTPVTAEAKARFAGR